MLVRHETSNFLCITLVIMVFLSFLSVCNVEPVTGCYGPQITAIIDETQISINENVTVTGRVYLIETKVTVRMISVRPMRARTHMSDRLGMEVVNPAPDAVDSEPVVNLPPFRQTSTSL
jgi:hypothetical protein